MTIRYVLDGDAILTRDGILKYNGVFVFNDVFGEKHSDPWRHYETLELAAEVLVEEITEEINELTDRKKKIIERYLK